jgi:hypothetical protein
LCCSLKKKSLHTAKELQQEISAAVISISEETLAAVVQNFRCRLQVVLDADDEHIENVFT